MKLKSTTWRHRNIYALSELREAMEGIRYSSPIVADVGIGGITRCLADLLPGCPKAEMTCLQKTQRFFVRLADNVARKYQLYGSLKNFELEEVKEYLSDFSPSKILVVDNDSRILDTIKEDGVVEKVNLDICKGPLPQQVDVVICYNVLQRTQDPQGGLNNLLNSIHPGGLISVDFGEANLAVDDSRYSKLGDRLYRRISN